LEAQQPQPAPGGNVQQAPGQSPQPSATTHPNLSRPQILAFAAFALFVLWTIISPTKKTVVVTDKELTEVRTLTLFLIGALLPSDALIRFGRNLLFQTVDDADKAAKDASPTTLAQQLAFGVYVILVLVTLFSKKIVPVHEYSQVNEVGRALIVALLPSDAGIRFGRALYYRSPKTPQPTAGQLKRV
jgi:hypothetical protein